MRRPGLPVASNVSLGAGDDAGEAQHLTPE